MKLLLKRELFRDFWTKPLEKVPEPGRRKKITEFCLRKLQNQKAIITRDDKLKLKNGIQMFLKNFREKEIEFEEDGKFYSRGN